MSDVKDSARRARHVGVGAGVLGLALAGWVWASPPWADRADVAAIGAKLEQIDARLERIERKLDR